MWTEYLHRDKLVSNLDNSIVLHSYFKIISLQQLLKDTYVELFSTY